MEKSSTYCSIFIHHWTGKKNFLVFSQSKILTQKKRGKVCSLHVILSASYTAALPVSLHFFNTNLFIGRGVVPPFGSQLNYLVKTQH